MDEEEREAISMIHRGAFLRVASIMTTSFLKWSSVATLLSVGLGCHYQCDPDEIFQEDFATSDWEACGDLLSEDDRSDAISCLEQALADTRPAFIRVSGDRGITYIFLDEEIQLGAMYWAGRAGPMSDLVQLYFPCDFEQTLDAFEQYKQTNLSCELPSKKICP